MTRVTRAPFSASMRETSKALSPPPITAICAARSAPGSPTPVGPRWTRPASASRRAFFTSSSHSPPRKLVPVAITTAGADKDRGVGEPADAMSSPNWPAALASRALGTGAEPGLDRKAPDVAGERGGILARTFSRPPEQPVIGIGAAPRHAAEHGPFFDDDRAQPVIVQPQRAGHARGPASDDRNDRHAGRCQSIRHGLFRLRLRVPPWFARVGSPQACRPVLNARTS